MLFCLEVKVQKLSAEWLTLPLVIVAKIPVAQSLSLQTSLLKELSHVLGRYASRPENLTSNLAVFNFVLEIL